MSKPMRTTYASKKHFSISEAWKAPVPKPADITKRIIATTTLVASITFPYFVMRYGCKMSNHSPIELIENMGKCFRSLGDVVVTPILAGLSVSFSLVAMRDLSYRIWHVVLTFTHPFNEYDLYF